MNEESLAGLAMKISVLEGFLSDKNKTAQEAFFSVVRATQELVKTNKELAEKLDALKKQDEF